MTKAQIFCKPYPEMTPSELYAEFNFWKNKTYDTSDWHMNDLSKSYMKEIMQELTKRATSALAEGTKTGKKVK